MTLSVIPRGAIAGVILAGGQSRRMGGGDKAMAVLGRQPLLAHVIDRIHPQVANLALNANGDAGRFIEFGLPVIADTTAEPAGPLAGILAGMTWAAAKVPVARWVVTAPADTPFIPRDLVARLFSVAPGGDAIAVARSRDVRHPVVALFPLELSQDLARWLANSPDRAVKAWIARHRSVDADFPDDADGCDPFFNINTPEDLLRATDLAERRTRSG
jgi:molybdopterin-guanine dinucleotide biosynthesis protein A